MPLSFCTVSGTVCNLDGTPNSDVQVRARVQSTEVDQGGQLLSGSGVTSEPIIAFTGDDGFFSIDLLQGARVEFHIPSINLRKVILVPSEASAQFGDLV